MRRYINTKENSNSSSLLVLSEVVDSKISFESPVLVRNKTELDIWFGENYSSRDFHEELLDLGIYLYLYKPTIDNSENSIDYINVDSLDVATGSYLTVDNLPSNPTASERELKYYVGSDVYIDFSQLIDGGEFTVGASLVQGYKYYDRDNNTWITIKNGIQYTEGVFWIWYEDGWVSVNDLPQNQENKSISLNNRDTLVLTVPETENIPESCSLMYNYNTEDVIYSSGESLISETENNINTNLNSGKHFAYKLIPKTEQLNAGWLGLIRYPNNTNLRRINNLLEGNSSQVIAYNNQYISMLSTAIRPDTQLYSWICDTKTISNNDKDQLVYYIKEVGYTYNEGKNIIYLTDSDDKFKTTTSPISNICNLFYLNTTATEPIISYSTEPDTKEEIRILTSLYNKNNTCISFYSKIIGRDNDVYGKNDITVKIENSYNKLNSYIITISKPEFGYEEVFEGSIKPEFGEKRLDDIINSGSKLVVCNLGNVENGLRTGTFKLDGSVDDEEITKTSYMNSLNKIIESSEDIFIDYILIPDLHKFCSKNSNYSFYPEYLKFIKYSKDINVQFLIQNNKSAYTIEQCDSFPDTTINTRTTSLDNRDTKLYKNSNNIYKRYIKTNNNTYTLTEETDVELIEITENGGDFFYNYTKDKDNRLIYFYQPLLLSTSFYERPGYYIYLASLLTRTYSLKTKNIIYNTDDLLPRDSTALEKKLEKYKSNFLVSNDLIYYYKRYLNGDDFNSTGWMRFILGKIQRELDKYKWKFLSERNQMKIESEISNLFSTLKNEFTIIKNINITNVEFSKNNLTVNIETYLADLTGDNITLELNI